jgi:ribonuclease HI
MIRIAGDGGVMWNGKPNSYCGWGSIIDFPDGTREIGSDACQPGTNNIAELMAIIMPLELLVARSYPKGTKVHITSDSQYVVGGGSEWIYTWERKQFKKKGVDMPNSVLWKRLWPLIQHFDIEWQWVKGHQGHELNEMCDQLATEAMKWFAEKHGL